MVCIQESRNRLMTKCSCRPFINSNPVVDDTRDTQSETLRLCLRHVAPELVDV